MEGQDIFCKEKEWFNPYVSLFLLVRCCTKYEYSGLVTISLTINLKLVGRVLFCKEKEWIPYVCASSLPLHNLAKVSRKHIPKYLHIIYRWSFLFYTFLSKDSTSKKFTTKIYIFSKLLARSFIPVCTVEKASLNLTCVKNIIIEGREGFNGLLRHHPHN